MYGDNAGDSINDSVDNGDYPSTSIQWTHLSPPITQFQSVKC